MLFYLSGFSRRILAAILDRFLPSDSRLHSLVKSQSGNLSQISFSSAILKRLRLSRRQVLEDFSLQFVRIGRAIGNEVD